MLFFRCLRASEGLLHWKDYCVIQRRSSAESQIGHSREQKRSEHVRQMLHIICVHVNVRMRLVGGWLGWLCWFQLWGGGPRPFQIKKRNLKMYTPKLDFSMKNKPKLNKLKLWYTQAPQIRTGFRNDDCGNKAFPRPRIATLRKYNVDHRNNWAAACTSNWHSHATYFHGLSAPVPLRRQMYFSTCMWRHLAKPWWLKLILWSEKGKCESWF